MATFKSNLATTQSQNGDNRVDGRLLAGKVRQCNATVTVDVAEVTGDIIEVVTLPTGALINLAESYIITEALGTTFTCNLGTENAATALATGLILASAAKVDVDADGGLYAVPAGEEKIVLTSTTLASVTAGKTARVVLTYIDYN